jgi:sugar phosphate isomerase/epimerase
MLSIVTDEVSYDLETAVSIGWKWGLREFELRRAYLERAPYYPEAFYELLPSLRKTYGGVRFVAVSPGLFKCPLDHWSVEHQGGLKLEASLRLAELVGCRLVILFGFERPAGTKREERVPQKVIDLLGAAAARAAREGYGLAVEIESSTYADCGTAAAELVEAVGSAALGVNMQRWNPAATGDPWDRGFERVRRHVRHMHYHGINAPEFGGAEPGKDFGWAPKIKALAADGYRGNISVETHLKPRLEKSEITLAALRRVLREAGVAE